jgi:predicted secreted protein
MGTFIKGDSLVLSVWDGTAYRPVACLTANSLSQTRGIIETQTKCDPGLTQRAAGVLSYELSAEGNYVDSVSAGGEHEGSASHDYLKTLMEAGNLVTWRLSTGLVDVPFYYGDAIITELSADAPTGDSFATFSMTLSGSDDIVEVDPQA